VKVVRLVGRSTVEEIILRYAELVVCCVEIAM